MMVLFSCVVVLFLHHHATLSSLFVYLYSDSLPYLIIIYLFNNNNFGSPQASSSPSFAVQLIDGTSRDDDRKRRIRPSRIAKNASP